MGSALQRLEILLIGLVVLIAGAVAAVLLVLRPPSQPAYQSNTPKPLVTHAPTLTTSAPVLGATSVPPQRTTTAPIPAHNRRARGRCSSDTACPDRLNRATILALWRRRATHRQV